MLPICISPGQVNIDSLIPSYSLSSRADMDCCKTSRFIPATEANSTKDDNLQNIIQNNAPIPNNNTSESTDSSYRSGGLVV